MSSMSEFTSFDWTRGDARDHQAMARRAAPAQLCHLARIYDWSMHPEEVLGWIMAQKTIDLASALTAFLNGEPERFNYMPKRDVPTEYRATARLLDNICLRVNSGFYLSVAGQGMRDTKRLKHWLRYQDVDRSEGRRGRWNLDERIVRPMDDKHELPEAVATPDNSDHTFLHDILSPLKGFGVSRDHLKYHPKRDKRGKKLVKLPQIKLI